MKQCSGCSSITILLRDDNGSYVPMMRCPFTEPWTQEVFLVSDFAHYQNGHLRWDLSEWPLWYSHAFAQLSQIAIEEAEKEKVN